MVSLGVFASSIGSNCVILFPSATLRSTKLKLNTYASIMEQQEMLPYLSLYCRLEKRLNR